jgi:hypothetical protein
MEAVDNMAKVEKMLELFDNDKMLNLTIIKHKPAPPAGLNKDDLVAHVPVNHVLLSLTVMVDTH